MNGRRGKERGMEQVLIGACVRIETHIMEGKPGRHSARIIVAWQTTRRIVEVLTDDLTDTLSCQVGTSYPMVETGRKERRLVVDVVEPFIEEGVEALAEQFGTSALLNEAGNVVGNAERIFPRGGFVHECSPPWGVPWTLGRDGCIEECGTLLLGVAKRHFI